MKRSVVFDELHELQLRPKQEFAQYLKLLEAETKERFPATSLQPVTQCPACQSKAFTRGFAKWGFAYNSCEDCGTVYASLAPSAESLQNFYSTSKALQYWAKHVLPATSTERREHLSRLRIDWILSFLDLSEGDKRSFLDFGTRDPAFWREVAQVKSLNPRSAFQPLIQSTDQATAFGFKVLDRLPEGTNQLATAFEVLETSSDPADILKDLNQALCPKGYLFITTRAGSGFDMQVLGAHAPNLLPPLHLSLLSVEGMTALLQRTGFEILELSTPGQLDVEVVANTLKAHPQIKLTRFFDDLIRRRDESVHEAFQEFLQTAQLSSHLRTVARKR